MLSNVSSGQLIAILLILGLFVLVKFLIKVKIIRWIFKIK